MHITVPVELAEQIRECLRRGEYATESDVVIDRFSDHEAVNLSPDELDEAFRLGAEALDEMERHPQSAPSHEQVWARLNAHRAAASYLCCLAVQR